MTLLEQLHRWRNSFRRQGDEPTFIPLTAEEISVVESELPAAQWNQTFMVSPPQVFGLSVFDSPFAEEMRARQISIPVTKVSESMDIPLCLYESKDENHRRDMLRRRLVANICSDTTRLKLSFEWDILAKFKRKFRLTRWWPVRTKTIRIDGRILYPYLKVSLPYNRHHTTFTHVP